MKGGEFPAHPPIGWEGTVMSLHKTCLRAASAIACLLVMSSSPLAGAETPAEFYGGRQVTLIVPTGPSGGYSVYGQYLAHHLGNHLPGKPTVVIKYMPGGGGNTAANYLYKVAPKDGSVVAEMFSTLPVTQALHPAGADFDATKFSWLGSIAPMINVVSVLHDAPAATLEDARKKPVVIGATGKSADLYIYPKLMNAILGTQFKIVLGYADSGSVLLAMESGEAQGVAMGLEAWRVTRPEWVKDNKVVMIAQNGLKRDDQIPNVPTLVELARTPEDKEVMEFVAVPPVLGRAFAAPPGIPQDRLAALRKAFEDTMKDPAFVDELKARGLSIQPTSGPDVAALMARVKSTPPAVVQRTKGMLGF
jgi:tripartite-type tricarboxylate transporter receptor subunit TctC